MLPLFIAIALVFVLLLVGRLGGAQRALLIRRWPSVLMGIGAVFLLLRGSIWPAIAFAALAALAWVLEPRLFSPPPPPQSGPEDPEDAAARSTLGVARGAGASEIRAAYRTKMRAAHPDRGGSHNEAARLAAARDRLLRKK
ncbi:hypothetical protein U91I_03758 [alpha proteobacterium U9-1i]|nr:hypothetical protein U91I_03758 [alpha proteobacterium U9-1i]